MGQLISLNARMAANAGSTDQIPVMLVAITHPTLAKPVRISSDPTTRLSVEPLIFGTQSGGEDYIYLLMASVLPDDQKDSPPKTTLVFTNVEKDIAKVVREITPGTYFRADIYVVLAGSPNVIERQFLGLRGVSSGYDGGQVTIDLSREPFTSEPWPAGRMTASRFPSLFN